MNYCFTLSCNILNIHLSSSPWFSLGQWPRPLGAGLPAQADAGRPLHTATARGIGPCVWSTALSWNSPWQHQQQARPGKGWGVGVCTCQEGGVHLLRKLMLALAWLLVLLDLVPALLLTCIPSLNLTLTFHLSKLMLGPWPHWCATCPL